MKIHLNKKQKAIWIIYALLAILFLLSGSSFVGIIIDLVILLILALILHKLFKTSKNAMGIKGVSDNIPKNTPIFKKVLLIGKENAKDIIIALILAFLAAVVLDNVNSRLATNKLQNDAKAVTTIFAYDKNSQPISQGSGFFISSDGILLTNFHVIDGSNYALTEAKLPNGAYYRLKKIIGLDKKDDIAILQFDAQGVPTVNLGNSDDIQAGDEVYTVGSPLDFENSISKGVISNPKRSIAGQNFIQFTAPISSGNSGGGLFNKEGAVLGMTSRAIVIPADMQKDISSQNINLAIPSNVINQVIHGQQQIFTENSPAYYYSLGSLADNKNDNDQAIADYQKAISIDDTYSDAYIGLGGDYYTKGQYDQELLAYQKAVSLDSKNANNLWLLASAYEDNGQYDQAITNYEKALQIKPDDKDSMYSLGILYSVEGQAAKLNALIPQLSKLDAGLGKELKLLSGNLR